MCTFFGAHFCPNFCEHMSRFFARTPCELLAKPTSYKLLPQGLRIWSNIPESSTLVLFPQGFLLFASVWHENRFRGSENEAMGILSGDATTGGAGRSQLCCISPKTQSSFQSASDYFAETMPLHYITMWAKSHLLMRNSCIEPRRRLAAPKSELVGTSPRIPAFCVLGTK